MSALTFFAGLLAVASASITVVGGSDPTGPAIYEPGLADVVPVGEQFSITWSTKDVSSCGKTVDLVLLHGASASTMQAISYIATKTDNNGSYPWTPSTDLAPATSGYGIELICEKNDAYQYTDQFGISNPDYVDEAAASTSSSSASSISTSTKTSSVSTKAASTVKVEYTTEVVTAYTTYCPAATEFAIGNKTYSVSNATTLTISDCPCTITKASNVTVAASTSYSNTSTKSHSTKSSSASTVTSTSLTTDVAAASTSAGSTTSTTSASASATSKGAASHAGASVAGFVIAAGVAVFAL